MITNRDIGLLLIVAIIVAALYSNNWVRHNVFMVKDTTVRYKAAKEIKPFITKVSHKYSDKFKADIKEVELVLALLVISETSAQAKDGNWYPLTSTLYKHNNLFGMKATKEQIANGNYVNKLTWEEVKNKRVNIHDNFATFSSKEECIEYWFEKITTTKRYSKVLEAKNYAEILIQLQTCGYMTDTQYPQKMLNVCKSNNIEEIYLN